MPAADTEQKRAGLPLLPGLLWAGVGLAPVAALLALFAGDSVALLRVAILLAIIALALIGVSMALRRDPEAMRSQVEDMVFEELDILRDDLREDITTAARATHKAIGERVVTLHESVEALRGQVDNLRGQVHRVPAQPGPVGPPQPAPLPPQAASPVPPPATSHGVVRHTETVKVTTRSTIVDNNDSAGARGSGTVYGSSRPTDAAPAQRRGPDPSSSREGESWTEQLLRERLGDEPFSDGYGIGSDRPADRGPAERPGERALAERFGSDRRDDERHRSELPRPEPRSDVYRSEGYRSEAYRSEAYRSESYRSDSADRADRWSTPARDERAERAERGTEGWSLEDRYDAEGRFDSASRSEGLGRADGNGRSGFAGRPDGSGRFGDGADGRFGPVPDGRRGVADDRRAGADDVRAPGGGRRRAPDADDEPGDRVTGVSAGDRWASVRSDDRGRELRMGERRADVRADGDGTELRIEDRWAAVRREEAHRPDSRREPDVLDFGRSPDRGRGADREWDRGEWGRGADRGASYRSDVRWPEPREDDAPRWGESRRREQAALPSSPSEPPASEWIQGWTASPEPVSERVASRRSRQADDEDQYGWGGRDEDEAPPARSPRARSTDYGDEGRPYSR